jgi:GlpG protein
MRMIGHLDSGVKARSFSDYLTVKGIENEVEPEKDGTWAVWIRSEEDLKWAKDLFELFRQNPADPRYQTAKRAAETLREQKQKEQVEYEKRVKQRRHLFRPLTGYGFGPVTFVLICVSVVVYALTLTDEKKRVIDALSISNWDLKSVQGLSLFRACLKRIAAFPEMLQEVRQGQVWRLITPIFLHFSFFHIFFNMLWLRDLGSMVEGRQSSWLLGLLVLVLAVLSNTAQFFVTGGGFGGMSGVVYGLLGYIWIRGKYDPGSGLFVHPTTVTMMIIWFFYCMVGFMGAIANAAHAVGLLTGMAWGFLSSLRHR